MVATRVAKFNRWNRTEEWVVMASDYPYANVGIATGQGLYVVDEDKAKGGDASDLHLEPTLMARTWSNGYHYFYRLPDGVTLGNSTSKLGPHVDTRGTGGYVVAPPSRVGMRYYAWLDYFVSLCPPAELPVLPPRIIEALQEPEKPARPPLRAVRTPSGNRWLSEAMRRTRNGTGDATGWWLACQLLIDRNAGAQVDVEAVLRQYAAMATYDLGRPFDDRSVQRWITSAGRSRIVLRGEVARASR
jgi:Bifunctional DNA primase/polymerase, N-terminal